MELSECGATLLVSEFRSWNVQIEIVINVIIVPIVCLFSTIVIYHDKNIYES